MSAISPKLVRQWMPMIGGGAFALWTVFLVMLSLFPAGKEAVPGRETKHMPTTPAPTVPPACLTIDGLSICDDLGDNQ